MQIQIPDSAVPEITRRAQAAGYGGGQEFVLATLLSEHDTPCKADPDDPELIAALKEGFASGVSETPFNELLDGLRENTGAKL